MQCSYVFITLLTQVVSSILRDTGYTVTPFAPATPDKRITLQARTQHNSVSASNHVRTRIATTLVNYTGDRVTFAYCISLNCIALLLYCILMTHVWSRVCIHTWNILGYLGIWVGYGQLSTATGVQGCAMPATILGAAGLWPNQGGASHQGGGMR